MMKNLLQLLLVVLIWSCQSNEKTVEPQKVSSTKQRVIRNANAKQSPQIKIIDRGFLLSTRENHQSFHNEYYSRFPEVQSIYQLESNGAVFGWKVLPPNDNPNIIFYKQLIQYDVEAPLAYSSEDGKGDVVPISTKEIRPIEAKSYLVDLYGSSEMMKSDPTGGSMPGGIGQLWECLVDYFGGN